MQPRPNTPPNTPRTIANTFELLGEDCTGVPGELPPLVESAPITELAEVADVAEAVSEILLPAGAVDAFDSVTALT